MTDFLYARQMAAKGKMSGDGDKDGNGKSEQMDVQKDVKLETNDVKVSPKDTATVDAVEREDHEHVQDITQRLQDTILSDQSEEASSGSANKSTLMTEEKQFAGTTKKKQSKVNLKSLVPISTSTKTTRPVWKH
jgi:hypothetical protein